MHNTWVWIAFNLVVLGLLALDLGVFHRKPHAIGPREAAAWSAFWVALSLAFAYGVHTFMGAQAGLEFLTGYLIEKALSVDNIFVFVLIFGYFRVPAKYQHRVLFWGILGALLMRGAMIAAGTVLLVRFHWITYVFGAFLVLTGIRMAFSQKTSIKVEANPIIRLLRRLVPISSSYHGHRFFLRESIGPRARLIATPLLVVVVLVETTDLVFALDSIPAIFAVTRDPFLVYTSNVCAILGLRALYFLLANVIHRFHFLKIGLAIVLSFVGVKMLIADFVEIPIGISLGVIALVLTATVTASLLFPRAPSELSDEVANFPPPPDIGEGELTEDRSEAIPHLDERVKEESSVRDEPDRD